MYLLDANIFIQAKNRHYAFDVVPGFWRWLERAHGIGIAGSVERVREELLVGQDEPDQAGESNGRQGLLF